MALLTVLSSENHFVSFVYERARFCVRDMEVLTVAGVAYGRCLIQFASKIDNVDFGWPVLIVSVDRGD